MWLLDANLDIRICEILTEIGIESQTAEALGWKTLSNGHLVAAALKQYPEFSIVVVRLKQEKWPAFGECFRRTWKQQPITPAIGQAVL